MPTPLVKSNKIIFISEKTTIKRSLDTIKRSLDTIKRSMNSTVTLSASLRMQRTGVSTVHQTFDALMERSMLLSNVR
jgi:hypothetical protein